MARAAETGNRPRRFYKLAEAGAVDAGFGVLLDGRAVRAPSGARLAVPTLPLAALLATEWAEQGELIDVGRMPATRLAFTAADRIGQAREATEAEIARYASADLLCYFAEAPSGLVERQARLWAPLLDWAEAELGLTLVRAAGIVHRTQTAETLTRVAQLAAALDDYGLAGLATAAGLFGSAVLAFALQRGRLDGLGAFDLSRLDETFQEEQWGVDAEAADRTAQMRADAMTLEAWFGALASGGGHGTPRP